MDTQIITLVIGIIGLLSAIIHRNRLPQIKFKYLSWSLFIVGALLVMLSNKTGIKWLTHIGLIVQVLAMMIFSVMWFVSSKFYKSNDGE